MIQDITDNDKTKKDRLAILVNIDGESKLLAIPGLENGGAESQHNSLVTVLEEYNLIEKIYGLVFDTTATNTGRLSGTNVRFSKTQDKLLLSN